MKRDKKNQRFEFYPQFLAPRTWENHGSHLAGGELHCRRERNVDLHDILAAEIAHNGVDEEEYEVVALGEEERARQVAHLLFQNRTLLRELQGVDVGEPHLVGVAERVRRHRAHHGVGHDGRLGLGGLPQLLLDGPHVHRDELALLRRGLRLIHRVEEGGEA